MPNQPPRHSPNTHPRYRVRRRRAPPTSDYHEEATIPKMHIRVRIPLSAGSNEESALVQSTIPSGPPSPGLSRVQTSEILNHPTGSSNLSSPSLPQRRHANTASHNVKPGQKTVAKLRQCFEQWPDHEDVNTEFEVALAPIRGTQRARSVSSAFAPVMTSAAHEDDGFLDNALEEGYILPATTFNPVAQTGDGLTWSLPTPESPVQADTSQVLRPTVYTGYYSYGPGSPTESTHSVSSQLAKGEVPGNATELGGNSDPCVYDLALLEAGVKVIDFAYMHAASKSSSSASGQQRAHWASRSEDVSSTQHKSEFESSALDSTEDLIKPSDYEKQHLPQSFAFPDEKRDDSLSESEEPLLLLPASVYVPPAVVDDNVVES